MAPARPAARWRSGGGFASRGDGTPQGGFKNQSGKRRTWRPSPQQAFRGSVREGQGFAFRRKLKTQQNYKKLLWKVKKAPVSQESQFTDHYPDHLKHLYLAEEERLRKQQRKVGPPPSEDQVDQPLPEEECNPEQMLSEVPSSDRQPQPEQLYTVNLHFLQRVQEIGVVNKNQARPRSTCLSSSQKAEVGRVLLIQCSDTTPKKKKKKTSNQKAQEEYERVQAKRAAKKFEFEMRKQEREEAQRLYKKKKMEAFKILSKKTKKGQPNLNLQMEYLLQKIQENS